MRNFIIEYITKIYNFSFNFIKINFDQLNNSYPQISIWKNKFIQIIKKEHNDSPLTIFFLFISIYYLFYTKIWLNDNEYLEFMELSYYKLSIFYNYFYDIFINFKNIFLIIFNYNYENSSILSNISYKLNFYKITILTHTPSIFNIFDSCKITFIKLILSFNIIYLVNIYLSYKIMIINFLSSIIYIIFRHYFFFIRHMSYPEKKSLLLHFRTN